MNEKDYQNIPAEKFRLANRTDRHDQKFDTKAVGYFGDAWNRFKKNKSSVVAACVILILVLYSIIGPYCCNANYKAAYATDNVIMRYQYLLPKVKALEGTGISCPPMDRKMIDSYLRYFASLGYFAQPGLTDRILSLFIR